MSVTTAEQEYKRLRAYLNPYLKGPTVEAVLTALATGASSSLINNAAAVNDQLYILTASGTYLDQRLADFGITRPQNIGVIDDIFRQIGIQVKNRKQVRDLINNILNIVFGDTVTKASSNAGAFEPYALSDGDTLIINFDDTEPVTIEFHASEFTNIAAATAQEVADAITAKLRTLGFSGSAVPNDDGNGVYVQLISSTIGPASSVTVTGGSAQNVLLFSSIIDAGGNMSTQWTLTLQSGGIIRFTWSAGPNPHIGNVSVGDYVNIFGGGFTSSPNEGSYTITAAVGGAVGVSYFEIENPLGTSGIIVQGSDDAVLFYNPVRKTLLSLEAYAAVYQTQSRILQIFMPATTRLVGRTRIGAAFLHDPPNFTYTFDSNPNINDQFGITTTTTLVAGTDFAIGMALSVTIQNLADAINAISGLDAVINNNTITVYNDDPALSLLGTYVGAASITSSGLMGDPISILPNQPGPYMYDTNQPYTVSHIDATLQQQLNGSMSRVFEVDDSSQFPNEIGYLIFEYGTENQEGPVPYIGTPSNNTLLISPIYTLQKDHPEGSTVTLIAQKSSVTLEQNGLDYPFYITDVASARVYAQNLIESVAATGIQIIFTILYPSDIGLGKWGTQYSENPIIWGP